MWIFASPGNWTLREAAHEAVECAFRFSGKAPMPEQPKTLRTLSALLILSGSVVFLAAVAAAPTGEDAVGPAVHL
jgi:hypothetical protein